MQTQANPSTHQPVEHDDDAVKATLSPAVLGALYVLYGELTTRLRVPVTIDYGSTDDGQRYAALCIETPDHWGPLVSVLWGTGVQGVVAIMAADGSPLCTVQTLGGLGMGMGVARDAALSLAGQAVTA